MEMSSNNEQADGIRWILGAGLAAVLIASFVAWSDHTLSTSNSEKLLGERLRELRTAQASLPTSSVKAGSLDPRQGNRVALREPAAPAILAAGLKVKGHGSDEHSGGHASGGDSHSGH